MYRLQLMLPHWLIKSDRKHPIAQTRIRHSIASDISRCCSIPITLTDLEQLQKKLSEDHLDDQLRWENYSHGAIRFYRPLGELAVLADGDMLTIPELFPGWEVPITELLPVEFE